MINIQYIMDTLKKIGLFLLFCLCAFGGISAVGYAIWLKAWVFLVGAVAVDAVAGWKIADLARKYFGGKAE